MASEKKPISPWLPGTLALAFFMMVLCSVGFSLAVEQLRTVGLILGGCATLPMLGFTGWCIYLLANKPPTIKVEHVIHEKPVPIIVKEEVLANAAIPLFEQVDKQLGADLKKAFAATLQAKYGGSTASNDVPAAVVMSTKEKGESWFKLALEWLKHPPEWFKYAMPLLLDEAIENKDGSGGGGKKRFNLVGCIVDIFILLFLCVCIVGASAFVVPAMLANRSEKTSLEPALVPVDGGGSGVVPIDPNLHPTQQSSQQFIIPSPTVDVVVAPQSGQITGWEKECDKNQAFCYTGYKAENWMFYEWLKAEIASSCTVAAQPDDFLIWTTTEWDRTDGYYNPPRLAYSTSYNTITINLTAEATNICGVFGGQPK